MEQLKKYLGLAWKTIKFTLLGFLAIYSYLSLEVLKYNTLEISYQNETLYLNQINVYNEMIKINATNTLIEYGLTNSLESAKAEALKRDNDIFLLIAGVDKNAVARDSKIIDVVNNEAERPSYEYLKSITLYLVKQSKTDEKMGWIGTGVVISFTKDFTYVLTNRHVMDNDTKDYDYYAWDGQNKYPLTSVKLSHDEGIDLSLVRLDGKVPGKQAVKGIGNVQPQDKVFFVGHNLGRPFLYSEGTVSGFDARSNDELVVGAPSGPGNSGSGIINRKGQLVGVLYAGSLIQEGFFAQMDTSHGLCIPSKTLRLFLAGYINE